MLRILKWIWHEFLNVLPAVIFFFVAFTCHQFHHGAHGEESKA